MTMTPNSLHLPLWEMPENQLTEISDEDYKSVQEIAETMFPEVFDFMDPAYSPERQMLALHRAAAIREQMLVDTADKAREMIGAELERQNAQRVDDLHDQLKTLVTVLGGDDLDEDDEDAEEIEEAIDDVRTTVNQVTDYKTMLEELELDLR